MIGTPHNTKQRQVYVDFNHQEYDKERMLQLQMSTMNMQPIISSFDLFNNAQTSAVTSLAKTGSKIGSKADKANGDGRSTKSQPKPFIKSRRAKKAAAAIQG